MKKLTKPHWIRCVALAAAKSQEQLITLTHRRVSYKIMVDEDGTVWDVPVTEDLIKHDPKRWANLCHTFEELKGS